METVAPVMGWCVAEDVTVPSMRPVRSVVLGPADARGDQTETAASAQSVDTASRRCISVKRSGDAPGQIQGAFRRAIERGMPAREGLPAWSARVTPRNAPSWVTLMLATASRVSERIMPIISAMTKFKSERCATCAT